ncbi:MAG: hypothetical protein LLG42_01270 [Chloroflexi bacterium]|nr:hypothetical protein [Chloroflexota bacterium]
MELIVGLIFELILDFASVVENFEKIRAEVSLMDIPEPDSHPGTMSDISK